MLPCHRFGALAFSQAASSIAVPARLASTPSKHAKVGWQPFA
jgi:hypothetical protein